MKKDLITAEYNIWNSHHELLKLTINIENLVFKEYNNSPLILAQYSLLFHVSLCVRLKRVFDFFYSIFVQVKVKLYLFKSYHGNPITNSLRFNDKKQEFF